MSSDDPEEPEVADVIVEALEDEETEGFTFGAVETNGYPFAISEMADDDGDNCSLCATILVQFAHDSDLSEKEFVRAVIQEFNQRKDVTTQ